MRTIGRRQVESVLFNLDSLRTSLECELYEDMANGFERYEEIHQQIDEVEDLMSSIQFGRIKTSEWNRACTLANERRYQRYCTCVAAGMDERDAAGAFQD